MENSDPNKINVVKSLCHLFYEYEGQTDYALKMATDFYSFIPIMYRQNKPAMDLQEIIENWQPKESCKAAVNSSYQESEDISSLIKSLMTD